MTITIAPAPAKGLKLVQANILPEDNHIALLAAVKHKPRPLIPHPVYTTSIDAVFQNRLLEASRPTAWQYILAHGQEPYLLAEVASNRQGRPLGLAYAASYERDYAQKTCDAMKAAHAQLNDSEKEYELRVLRAPTLYFRAVWLHAKDDDVLFPIAPVPVEIKANEAITAAALTEALLPLAKQRTQGSDRG
jgi:hypothetical protein